ncbi:MAG: hypothetical protein KAT06_12290 [Gammaproteobacteria bacterium]|nr:hypothetical protein [Gammaproteobacteria bacterium]
MINPDHVINELLSFKDFIVSITRNEAKLKRHSYMATGVIQTYYEYIACILDKKIEMDRSNYSKRLSNLKTKGMLSEQQFEILDRTRLFRNKLQHNLVYKPNLSEVVDFYEKCLPNSNTGDLSTPEMLERGYVQGIVNGYCFIEGSLMETIGKCLEEIDENIS